MNEKFVVKKNNIIIPCVPTRDLVVYPNMVMHFDVGRETSIKSIKNALWLQDIESENKNNA